MSGTERVSLVLDESFAPVRIAEIASIRFSFVDFYSACARASFIKLPV